MTEQTAEEKLIPLLAYKLIPLVPENYHYWEDAVKQARELLNLVKQAGYKSPEEVTALLNEAKEADGETR